MQENEQSRVFWWNFWAIFYTLSVISYWSFIKRVNFEHKCEFFSALVIGKLRPAITLLQSEERQNWRQIKFIRGLLACQNVVENAECIF